MRFFLLQLCYICKGEMFFFDKIDARTYCPFGLVFFTVTPGLTRSPGEVRNQCLTWMPDQVRHDPAWARGAKKKVRHDRFYRSGGFAVLHMTIFSNGFKMKEEAQPSGRPSS